MEEINFEKWFLDNYQEYRFKPLKYILETITPYFDYLPNTKNCLLWLFNENDGSYSYRHDGERYFDFIIKVEDRIKDYSRFEKLVIVKILITFLEREYRKDAETDKKELLEIYTITEIKKFEGYIKLQEKTLLHFDLQFKKLNNNLPFLIIDILDKEEDFLKWTIEKNPNYKEITQTPPPDEVEPTTDNFTPLTSTQVDKIGLYRMLGIIDFLKDNNPDMNNSDISRLIVELSSEEMKPESIRPHLTDNIESNKHPFFKSGKIQEYEDILRRYKAKPYKKD